MKLRLKKLNKKLKVDLSKLDLRKLTREKARIFREI